MATESDPHDGIPTDENGIPVFFVLPPELCERSTG